MHKRQMLGAQEGPRQGQMYLRGMAVQLLVVELGMILQQV